MSMPELLLIAVAGIVAGGVNAIAGGGIFFIFPAMLAAGLPPITATASSAIAVWPGHAAALPAYRDRLAALRAGLGRRVVVAVAGGLAGALLLLWTGDRAFARLIPWLLLIATLLFAFGPKLRSLMPGELGRTGAVAAAVELAFAVYGGYFGAGLGVLLMACYALLGHDDIHDANALKNLVASVITAVSIATFALSGVVAWPAALAGLAGAVAGGWLAARWARRVPAVWLRRGVIATGALLTVHFFLRFHG